MMKTNARNQFMGTVSAYKTGAVNDEVEITLASGVRIVAVVTRESGESLGLKVGAKAFALVKASSVVLATDLKSAKLSARNQLEGKITTLTHGAVNAEVVVNVGSGVTVAAVVAKTSAQSLGLAVGGHVTAFFKASSVILGTMKHSAPAVRVPASRVVWGLTIMKNAPNEANAIKFLKLLFSGQGTAIQQSTGPEPIAPPVVSREDYRELPSALRALVRPVHTTH